MQIPIQHTKNIHAHPSESSYPSYFASNLAKMYILLHKTRTEPKNIIKNVQTQYTIYINIPIQIHKHSLNIYLHTHTHTLTHTQNIPETRLLLLFYPKQKLRPGELPDDKKVNYPIQIDLCYL